MAKFCPFLVYFQVIRPKFETEINTSKLNRMNLEIHNLKGLNNFTTETVGELSKPENINIKPEYIRLPTRGLCPFTGLSRSKLYELILASETNNYSPPVKSVSLRKKGQIKGTRLIVLQSLLDYLKNEVETFQKSIEKEVQK